MMISQGTFCTYLKMFIIISRDATFILFNDFDLVGEVPVCKQKVLKKMLAINN